MEKKQISHPENIYIRLYGFTARKAEKVSKNLDNSTRCSSIQIHRKTSQIHKRKRRGNPTSNLVNIRQNRPTRRKTTPRPRLVVHPHRKHPAKSLHTRTHRHRKTTIRLWRKKRLQRQTQPRIQSRRKQHPKNPPAARNRRVNPNHAPTGKKNVSQRKKTASRNKRRPEQGLGQNYP